MSAEAPTIKQLPESVTVRLRSTLVITTLSDAISELVQNSLDAGARNIKIQANLSRNSCVVEDDGVGIAPVDVSMVGKMYATSKYPLPPSSVPTTFGFRGQALGSLATHSLFTLTSRHQEHRSTHTIRISYSAPIFTGLAPEHLRLPAAGTVVRIEGLWGDMPVRLKARQQEDVEREWENVGRVIVQLLLTPQGKGVGVVVRDDNGNRRLAVKDGSLEAWELSILRQAYGRGVVGSGWEKVKAQQGGVKIEGWICTKGSGTREFQFLYINNHPLPPSTTLLHAEVNRILAASSFGVIEEDENKISGSKVKSGPRKGVEKWGMFILRIECVNAGISILGGEGGTEGKSGLEGDHLKSAINLLQKLVREFLKTHHFRPFSAHSSVARKDPEARKASPPILDPVEKGAVKPWSSLSTPLVTTNNGSSSVSGTSTVMDSTHRDLRALTTWSRVKSAKTDPREEEGRQITGFKTTEFTFFAHPSPETAINPVIGKVGPSTIPEMAGSVNVGDELAIWTNPVSKKSFKVNTRTGNTAVASSTIRGSEEPSQSNGMKRPSSGLSCLGRKPEDNSNSKRFRRSKSVDTGGKGTFVEQLLKNWKNPVFKTNEAPIPQLRTDAQLAIGGLDYISHNCVDGFVEATSTTLGKLTKDGLRNAQVIAQIDQKYILIKMYGITIDDRSKDIPGEDECELLVIVDQHAADERVRVESLFTDICAMDYSDPAAEELHTPDQMQKTLVFSVNKREWDLMRRYENIFREWGISYHVSTSRTSARPRSRQGQEPEELSLKIDSLPRAITERCTNEPKLAIDMIRKHVYELSERSNASTNASHPRKHAGSGWAKRIGSCPKGLLDMINSKACRSAIMFNDPLSLDECRVLIGKLGECAFPFQCAHGRPSMIPLVDLRVPSTLGLDVVKDNERGGGFKGDFEKWMRKGEFEG